MNLPWGTSGSNDVKKHFDTPNHKNNKKNCYKKVAAHYHPAGKIMFKSE